jgi:GH15 family glucan-1,4-alpha-glucosidase
MLRIEDYALIGDTLTTALVGRDGSVDWLCVPRVDSGACFAALLGTAENGRWLIAPAGDIRAVERRYRGDSLILETRFVTGSGSVVLTDFMRISRARAGQDEPIEMIRLVRGERGAVPMRFEFVLRFDYGSIIPWVRRRPDGISAIAGPSAMLLRTPLSLEGRDNRTVAEFVVHEGETIPSSLMHYFSFRQEPQATDPFRSLAETEAYWLDWAAQYGDKGEWRDPVVRSLITLKALTYSPTGGIVAAPTTSLPESLGGVRNWDYRYCWLRDATFTLYALLVSGYLEEAKAWREWLLKTVAGDPSTLQVLYGVAGERRTPGPGFRDMAGLDPCASGTWRTRSSNGTSMARSWTRCKSLASTGSSATTMPGGFNACCWIFWKATGTCRIPASGKCGATAPIYALRGHGVDGGRSRDQGRRDRRSRWPGRPLARVEERDPGRCLPWRL